MKSFVIRESRPYDADRLESALQLLATTLGEDMLRYKGVLHIAGNPDKIAFQGVHMIMGGEALRPWVADEPRESVMVFIGRNLPEMQFRQTLETCVVK